MDHAKGREKSVAGAMKRAEEAAKKNETGSEEIGNITVTEARLRSTTTASGSTTGGTTITTTATAIAMIGESAITPREETARGPIGAASARAQVVRPIKVGGDPHQRSVIITTPEPTANTVTCNTFAPALTSHHREGFERRSN